MLGLMSQGRSKKRRVIHMYSKYFFYKLFQIILTELHTNGVLAEGIIQADADFLVSLTCDVDNLPFYRSLGVCPQQLRDRDIPGQLGAQIPTV